MMRYGLQSTLFWLFCSMLHAETIAITDAKIYTITGPVIEKGTIVISDGKIEAVGSNIGVPSGARVISASGKIVFPGFIDANCRVGLVEVDQVQATNDASEPVDPVTPQLVVTDGFFPESATIGVTRSNGVTSGIVAPLDENVFSGVSALISFSGRQIDQVVLRPRVALNVTLGEAPKSTYGEKNKMPMTRMGTAALLRETLWKARDYAVKWKTYNAKKGEKRRDKGSAATAPEIDLKLQSVLDVLEGKIPLVVSAHRVDDIRTAIRISEEFGIKRQLIINHGTDAYKIADLLAREKIPVIIGPITTQPETMQTLGALYDTAARLHKSGVLIALQSNDAHNARNLPYEAGIAVAHGLPYDVALKALTINVARIFGVDSDVGSIDKGKRADLIVANGDPLEPRTEISHVFIGGQEMTDLNYHRRSWEEFLKSQTRR